MSKIVPKVRCAECGREMLRLTHTHLEIHGLDLDQYIEKYGFEASRPSVEGKTVLTLTGGPKNTALNDASHREIITMAIKGYPRKTICDAIGIAPTTMQNWLKWGQEYTPTGEMIHNPMYYKFYQDYMAAEAQSEMNAIDTFRDAAKFDWKAALEYLSRRFPDHWRPESKKIIEGQVGVTHKVVTDLDVDRLYADPEAARMACELLEKLSQGDREEGIIEEGEYLELGDGDDS